MDFEWTEQQRQLKAGISGLFDEAALRELDVLEEEESPGIRSLVRRYLRLLAGTGYLELGVGPDGRAQALTLMAGQEELARGSGSLFLAVEVTARLFAGLVKGFGNPERVGDIAAAVERGELIGSVAISEPARAGYAGDLYTEARPDGDGYVLNGTKNFVTNGPIADYSAVVARVDNKLGVFLVEPGATGLSTGPRLRTLGYNGLAVCSLELKEVFVPGNRVLGPFEDTAALEYVQVMENLVLAMASVGLMHRTLFAARKHASRHERESKPVIAHQEIRFKLAEMLTLLQTSQLLTYRAGWMYATANPETVTLVHCSKVFAAEASERVSTLAMQIMAGEGYLSGNVVERGYREAKYAALAGTTSERCRMSIADDLLSRYK